MSIKCKKILITLILTALYTGLGNSVNCHAFWGTIGKAGKSVTTSVIKLGKVKGALPDSKIVELVGMINKGGDLKKVGKILDEMKIGDDVLEDTYMRIILKQKKLTRKEAEEVFVNLRGADGFRTTLRKSAGISAAKTSGHLNEINLANEAVKSNFTVTGIGKLFNDGTKKITDIDVLLKKNNKLIAIEAKKYEPHTPIPLDKFRADMATLVAYQKQAEGKVIPVFSMTSKPASRQTAKLLEKEAERRGVQLIYGSPDEQVHLINQLVQIL